MGWNLAKNFVSVLEQNLDFYKQSVDFGNKIQTVFLHNVSLSEVMFSFVQ